MRQEAIAPLIGVIQRQREIFSTLLNREDHHSLKPSCARSWKCNKPNYTTFRVKQILSIGAAPRSA